MRFITLLLRVVRSACSTGKVLTNAQALEGATIETRMSLLQKQLGVGDACTFRLIEKNVVSLLPPSKADLRKDASRALTDLIRRAANATWHVLAND